MVSTMSNFTYDLDSCGYLLVVHGSRNPLYAQQLLDLLITIRQGLSLLGVSCLIDTAYLELGKQSLSDKIIQFGQELREKGYKSLKILPLFLLSGTHVVEDIPSEVEIARQYSSINIEIMSHLGKDDKIISLLKTEYEKWGGEGRILFCHGTNLKKGNEEIESLAKKIDAKVAYWSINPTLTTIITQLASHNLKKITILPYFLFHGKILEAIASDLEKLQREVNSELILLPPLKKIENLSDLIIDSMINLSKE